MKIKLYGTGSFAAKSASPSALIDDCILFDCAPELTKKLIADKVDFEKINTIIISHFHADHDFDLPSLLCYLKYNTKKKPEDLTIIAPKGASERYIALSKLANFGTAGDVAAAAIIEIDETELEDGIEIDGYTIQPYNIDHTTYLENYGYAITKNGKTAGFSGDAVLCDTLHKLVEESDIAFVDITGPTPSRITASHMDIPDYELLVKKYPRCKVIPTHMSDNTKTKLAELGYNPPSDGDVFEIKRSKK